MAARKYVAIRSLLILKEEKRRCEIALKLYKMVKNLDPNVWIKDLIHIQWLEILSHVTVGAGFHSKKANQLNIGLVNDTQEPDLDRLSRLAIGYILDLIAQGDLCYEDSDKP